MTKTTKTTKTVANATDLQKQGEEPMNGNSNAVEQYEPEVLDALACNPWERPKDAPTFDDVAGALRAVCRDGDALVLDYAPAAADRVSALVRAETSCCSTMDWRLERIPATGDVRLRIEGSRSQLDALESLVRPAAGAAADAGGR